MSQPSCPDCGAAMAADQRYCLSCGHRRGEPRLPFMDAATLIEPPDARGGAGRTPPPPPSTRRYSPVLWNPNAALLTGVAILLLAVGVGFLVGRAAHAGSPSGSHVTERITIENGTEAPGTPQGGSEGHGPEGSLQPGAKHGSESPGATTPSKKPSASEPDSQAEEEEAEQRTKEAIHYDGPGKLAKPKATVGETCEPGTPGCGKNHIFEGEFFGTEE